MVNFGHSQIKSSNLIPTAVKVAQIVIKSSKITTNSLKSCPKSIILSERYLRYQNISPNGLKKLPKRIMFAKYCWNHQKITPKGLKSSPNWQILTYLTEWPTEPVGDRTGVGQVHRGTSQRRNSGLRSRRHR